MAIAFHIHRRQLLPYGVYALVTLLVMAPLLQPGFILTLDMIFTPRLHMPHDLTSSYLFHAGLSVLNTFLPAELLEKTMLSGTLFAASVGMHRLLGVLRGKHIEHTGMYAASIFYALNPFTYSRFMAGQYAVLLGYMLLPWLLASAIQLTKLLSWRQAARVGIWTAALGVVSIHTIIAILILGVSGLTTYLWLHAKKRAAVLRMTAIAGGVALLLSSYWLIPALLGHSATVRTVSSFTDADITAFTTNGASFIGRLGNIVRLQGFWADSQALYLLPQDVVMGWGTLMLGILALVITGLRSLWTQHRTLCITLTISTIIAGFIAAGAGTLLTKLSFGAALREPQKLVGLLALTYSIGLAYGITACIARLRRSAPNWSAPAAAALVLLPCVTMRIFAWGGNGQLQPVQYPAGWEAVNEQLKHDRSQYTALFLPWHQYMSFGFAGRIIANPAENYFDQPVISSADPEFKGAVSGKQDERRQAIQAMLAHPSTSSAARQLANLNVKYIIASKDADDAGSAQPITHAAHINRIYDSPSIALYINQDWRTTQ